VLVGVVGPAVRFVVGLTDGPALGPADPLGDGGRGAPDWTADPAPVGWRPTVATVDRAALPHAETAATSTIPQIQDVRKRSRRGTQTSPL
jgi:hypothetical protein